MDPAGLAHYEGLLTEFNETVLARETLPTFTGNPGWIDASGRPTCGVARRAVRRCAIPRSRHSQVSGHGDLFGGIRQVSADGGVPAYRSGSSPAR